MPSDSMFSRRRLLTLPLFAPVLAAGQNRRTDPERSLAIRNVTVIDGNGGAPSIRTVVITGERIAAVETDQGAPSGSRIVDGRGRFLIPGLWDMHVHLSYTKASALPALLANGVTGVRDMGGMLREIDEWRVKISTGALSGPRIFRAGPVLNGQAFAFQQFVVANAEEARGAVRALHKAGVDFLKCHRAISREAYFGAIEEAKKLSLPLTGHIPRVLRPEEASDAGQLTIEHAETLFEGTFSAKLAPEEMTAALKRFSDTEALPLFERFARNGTWFDPTLTVSGASGARLMNPQPDPRDKYISQSARKIMADLRPKYRQEFTPAAIGRLKEQHPQILRTVGLLQKAGVRLLTGTDLASTVTYPGFSLHDELALLVESGLTPMQALEAGTRNPARVLRQDDLGTIEKGKIADLILLDANPLADIRNTSRIRAVIYGGHLLDRAALDGLLREAEEAARVS